ncbi:MAG TPA: DUF4190 domain-containing protein [Chthoniobacteraceae bacterium]|jgi:hypothetical protein|nr:DUF4190 domain-containing protein [Chthoniobacteraceae bacterium]
MEIHLAREGRKFGPYSLEEVRSKMAGGELQAGDLAWYEGAPDWMPVTTLPMFNPAERVAGGGPPPLVVPRLPASPYAPTSGLAIASLACGIAAWSVMPFIPALPAIVCGHMALDQIRRSAGAIAGRGLALAGLIIGYCSLALLAALIAGLFAFGFAMTSSIQDRSASPAIPNQEHADVDAAAHAEPEPAPDGVAAPAID